MSSQGIHGHAGRPTSEAGKTTRESDADRLAAERLAAERLAAERLAAEKLDRELDEGLEESFPASDPPAPTQPHKEVDED
ncbi:hypothetical protein NYQ83_11810 [Afifella sp. JA880]|uniref:hypothetical protein n=1 Tax=Afifella sp. JA880 TaxID=2975280 RepID=UPI0021BB9033|nr:hypothetical protein [Afifella sp. JA880]MCT8267959.1 hypothetical protein [Afifella sp. JA880]